MANYGVYKRIPPYDVTRTKFNTYRQWRLSKNNFLSSSIANDEHITFLVAQEPDPSQYPGGIVAYDSIYSANEVKNTNITNNYVGTEYYASAVWYSLDHIYYNDPYTYNSYGNLDNQTARKNLYMTASVISIPQRYFGDTIKPGSVQITTNGIAVTGRDIVDSVFVDDSKGNITDTYLSASIASANQQLYLGFNKYKYYSPSEYDIPYTNFTYIPNNVTYVESDIIHTWAEGVSGSIGLAAKFSGSSYIQIRENIVTPWSAQSLSPEKDEEFTIAFWLFVNSHYATNSSSYNYIISKRREGRDYVLDLNNNITYTETDINTNKFPYEIRIANTGSNYTGNSSTVLEAVRSDGTNTVVLSTTINTGESGSIYRDNKTRNAYHIAYQKSGSMMQLFLDGTKIASGSDTIELDFNNHCDLFIGNLGKNYGGFDGTIDEMFYFNTALSDNQIAQLSSHENCINTNIVGNVFYEHGVIVISDPRPRYNALAYYNASWNTISGSNLGPGYMNTFNVNFKSKLPIEEVEILCRMREDEFTFSTNPTTLKDYRYSDVIDAVTSSYWSPYITTIGLYNDNYELLAVGKLANPISKLTNADLNILVRFDI